MQNTSNLLVDGFELPVSADYSWLGIEDALSDHPFNEVS
jgi:hypothetical protein